MRKKTEEYIIKACQRNEISAQKELYSRYVDKLYYVIFRYVNDNYYTENILQDVFLKAFIHISKYDKNIASFSTWIRTIAVRESINHCKKNKIVFIPIDTLESKSKDIETATALSQLQTEDILMIISTISKKYRIIFNLYELDGFNHAEISNLLGIAESTSRSYLTRAKELIREQLSRYYSYKIIKNETSV